MPLLRGCGGWREGGTGGVRVLYVFSRSGCFSSISLATKAWTVIGSIGEAVNYREDPPRAIPNGCDTRQRESEQ